MPSAYKIWFDQQTPEVQELYRQKKKNWVKNNPHRIRQYKRGWRKRNKARVAEYNREWRKNNPGRAK